jgi:hypothetical protein
MQGKFPQYFHPLGTTVRSHICFPFRIWGEALRAALILRGQTRPTFRNPQAVAQLHVKVKRLLTVGKVSTDKSVQIISCFWVLLSTFDTDEF